MDQAGGTGSTIAHPAGPKDAVVLGESFRNILDIPYVTVNLIDGEIIAEVLLTGDEMHDRLRLSAADSAAAKYNQRSYARRDGDMGVTIHYSAYPDGGV